MLVKSLCLLRNAVVEMRPQYISSDNPFRWTQVHPAIIRAALLVSTVCPSCSFMLCSAAHPLTIHNCSVWPWFGFCLVFFGCDVYLVAYIDEYKIGVNRDLSGALEIIAPRLLGQHKSHERVFSEA